MNAKVDSLSKKYNSSLGLRAWWHTRKMTGVGVDINFKKNFHLAVLTIWHSVDVDLFRV